MSKNVQLLLTENVEGLGIVGDVVEVRAGYARNFLLPHAMATTPSEDKIEALAEKRKQAEAEMRALRAQREQIIEKLEGYELTVERSCNDQGHLYGSVTQKDIADALGEEGFAVRPRDIRIAQPIKRLDSYEIPIVFDTELRTTMKLWVIADRRLDLDDRPEMEFDNEGNLIEVVQPETEEEVTPEAAPAPTAPAETPVPPKEEPQA
jgi:large subunit ribosomal protein L9